MLRALRVPGRDRLPSAGRRAGTGLGGPWEEAAVPAVLRGAVAPDAPAEEINGVTQPEGQAARGGAGGASVGLAGAV